MTADYREQLDVILLHVPALIGDHVAHSQVTLSIHANASFIPVNFFQSTGRNEAWAATEHANNFTRRARLRHAMCT